MRFGGSPVATTARAMADSGTRRATLPVLAVTRRGRRAPALTMMVRGPGQKAAMRASVLQIVASRGKMHNPVTGSGGMLTGVVEEAGPDSPLGLRPGDAIATLVSLSLTPLVITDGLASWDGTSEQVPCEGHAILFGASIAAPLPAALPAALALAVLDVCGAPALTHRVVEATDRPVVAILGAAVAGHVGGIVQGAGLAAAAALCVRAVQLVLERAGLAGHRQ